MLSVYNKIIEKVLHERIMKFILKNKILDSYQFGFRPRCNAEVVAIEVVSQISQALDKKKTISAIFIDMRKVFDLVDKITLMKMIESAGLREETYGIIESYLTNRTQRVKNNDKLSKELCIETGVVQGSILGSLLFNIFINGISKINGLNGKIYLYADDIMLINTHEKRRMSQLK
jgi:hypothetical protein